MKKLGIILILAACLTLLCIAGASADIPASGECGSPNPGDALFTFDSSTGALTISGTGEFFSAWDYADRSKIKSVVIEEGITTIGDGSFSSCTKLTSVQFPSSLTTIENSAFSSCGKLTNITLPSGLTDIGDYAFSSCTSLKGTLTIPATVTSVGKSAFSYCGFSSVTIPEGWTEIPDGFLNGNNNITSLTIPEHITEIGDEAFSGCSGLKSVIFKGNITKVGAGAFCWCDKIAVLDFPDSITEVGDAEGTSGSSEPYNVCPPVSANLNTAKAKMFSNAGYSIRVPGQKYNVYPTYSGDKVTSMLVTKADSDCASIALPEGVTEICNNVFSPCEKMISVALPATLTTIGEGAFNYNLFNVFYAGTEQDWKAITIKQYNENLTNGPILHYGESSPANLTDVWTVSYDWDFSNPDQGKLKAKAVCKNHPEHVVEETVNAWPVIDTDKNPNHAYPTCTEDGLANVESYSFTNKCFEIQKASDYKIPAYGHEYKVTKDNQPQYAWAIDYSKAIASLRCNRCGDEKYNLIEEAETTATTQGGKKTYTATFKDERFEDQSITVVAGRDITPPQLKKVTLNSHKISKPGILYVTLDFVEEESGLASCWINTCEKGKTNWTGSGGENWESDPPFTGTITLEVPIDTKFPAGEHYVTNIQLQDTQKNSVNYNVDTWYYSPTGDYDTSKLVVRDEGRTNAIIATVPIDNGFEVTEDSDADFEYLITAPKLMDAIKNLRKDGQGVILFNYNQHTAPKAMFEAMKEKDATFTFSNNEIQWQWAGSDLTEECKDIDLQVNSWTAPGSEYGIEGDEDVLVIQFADNGKLPGPVKIRLKSDYYFKINGLKRAAYLYFSNNGQLYNQESGVNAVLDQGDHWCEFTITHNSTYIVSANKAKKAEEDPNNKHEHTLTKHDKVEPTGKETGVEGYWECTECGKLFSDEEATKEIAEPVTIPKLTSQELAQTYISRCYQQILNREPKEKELQDWYEKLKNKTAGALNIIDALLRSEEFKNRKLSTGDTISILYQMMLNRDADEGGKASWTDAIEQGAASLQDMILGFNGSAEFTALLEECGVEQGHLHRLTKHDRVEPTGTAAGTEEYWECSECGKLFSDADATNEITEPVSIDKLTPQGLVQAFVKRCYKLILNREADEDGLKGWSDALISKTATAAQIIDGFVRSPEFINRSLGNDAAVDILYNTMLNRAADAEGKAGWVDALNKGYTLQNIIDGFCGSPEFKAICESFGIEPGSVGAPVPADTSTPRGKIEAFVRRCYSLILSRDADQGGLQGWSDALESGAGQACQIIDGFVRSEEYTNRNLDAGASVDILYKTMLNREPDPDGRAGWVDALGQGYTLQHIINGFCGSAEFTAICNDYGITAGTLSVASALVKREAITPEGDEAEAPVVYQGYNSEFINEEKVRAFVEHCYVAVFGREGDAEGIENYTKLILNGRKMPKKVAYEFIFSPEFQEKLPGNEEFIRILYRLYFDREPGAEELAGWVKMLEDGASLEEVVNGFAGSDEFKAIVNRMKE